MNPRASQIPPLQARLSVSTWSLHHHLGAPPFSGPLSSTPIHDGTLLLELPAKLADFGIQTLEICHFHLPALDENFLQNLRAELLKHDIELWSLLVDEGDLNGAHAARDFDWIGSWFPVARTLNAKNVRVIAGRGAPTPQNLAQSIAFLRALSDWAQENELRLLTENWFDLTSTPESTIHVLEELGGKLGLCLDFGNWSGPQKYENLARIAPYAESCHTKARFPNGEIERDDFEECLRLVHESGFRGPHTLIYDSGGDEWAGLSAEREIVARFLR